MSARARRNVNGTWPACQAKLVTTPAQTFMKADPGAMWWTGDIFQYITCHIIGPLVMNVPRVAWWSGGILQYTTRET
jgi:hypothetical protein